MAASISASSSPLSRSAAVSMCRLRSRAAIASAPALSPRPAAEAAASNWSVTLAIADTTTTGASPRSRRPRTIAVVRRIAAASSTEVPPNFITTRVARASSARASALRAALMPAPHRAAPRLHLQLAQPRQHLCVQHRRARRPANRIVREHHELPVQQVALAQPAHGRSHAMPAHPVQPRLRPVGTGVILHRLLRRAGQPLSGERRKLRPRRQNLLARRLRPQLDADALGVPVLHGHAVAVRAHLRVQQLHASAGKPTQQLAHLFLQLLFLVLDERHHVAQNVQRSHAGITRSAHRLHGRHKQALDAEALLQRLQRQHQANRAAVGIGDDVPAGQAVGRRPPPALPLDQRQMVGVDLRHHQRHVLEPCGRRSSSR